MVEKCTLNMKTRKTDQTDVLDAEVEVLVPAGSKVPTAGAGAVSADDLLKYFNVCHLSFSIPKSVTKFIVKELS